MCKSDTIVMIDSNDRTAGSASTSDFTVNLPSQLLINDDNGIQLKSLYVPNTLKTINTAINDKLYTSLDDGTSTAYNIITLPAKNYSNKDMDLLVDDLQNALDNVYPNNLIVTQSDPNSSASINGAVGNWTRNTGLVVSVSNGLDNQRYSYTNPTHGNRFLYFSEWDEDANVCKLEWSHTLNQYPPNLTLAWNGTLFADEAGSSFTFTPPNGFSFTGAYSPTLATGLEIVPSQSNIHFHIYTDGDLRNKYQGVDVAPNFGLNASNNVNKSNLQSANALFNNTGTRAAITTTNKFATTITDFRPLKALYLTTNIPISSLSSSGKTNFLKRILVKDANDICTVDTHKHYVDVIGQQRVSSLSFKLVDLYDNVINLGGKNMSFSLVIKQ